ncbi:2-hydroxyacyl-CoA dehydratase [Chloroflexota bacterium]
MLMQKGKRLWETRPLDSWQKAKELRQQFYQSEATAKEEKVWLVDGANATTTAGIGNCHVVFCQPLGASIAAENNEFARHCRAATEYSGYGRDMCAYMLNALGAMFLNRGLMGREFHKRDFVMAGGNGCDMHLKHSQIVAEFLDVPHHFTDWVAYYGEEDAERDEARNEYIVTQALELIEWLEKTTGTKFDDENFIETAKSGMRLQALRGDTIAYMQNIPTPLDQKSFYSIFILGGLVRTQQEETEKFWEMLRDEMKWRAENKIAALATERFRWVEEEPPPWFYLKYYRYMEEYGAVCIGSPYTHQVRWELQSDGTVTRPKTPIERGVPLDTREDIIRAQLRGSGSQPAGHGPVHNQYLQTLMTMIKGFHADGAILPLHRSGVGCVYGERENAVKLEEMGIPFMHYETSHPGNREDFSEARLLDHLDVFMESQGLRKLEIEE